MIILGIETTCDETSAAVVEDEYKVLSNVVASSADLYKKYGGVVPEVAAREQVRVIIPVIEEAQRQIRQAHCKQAQGKLQDVDAIAVAYGPGLVGSLLVGVETVKTLALVLNKPLIPVNHLIGHVYANWLTVHSSQNSSQFTVDSSQTKQNSEATVNREQRTVNFPRFPLIALIVSGGHTDLILMTDHGKYKWLGGTRDDAAGEAFDKVARVLGLGYPGGPEIERVARQFTVDSSQSTVKLPRPMISSNNFDFSFSGLKTAVVNLVRSSEFIDHRHEKIAEVAAEFQRAIVDVLVTKTIAAAKKFGVKSIVVGGGVAANLELRGQLLEVSKNLRTPVYFPPVELCVDNGAMIAAAAFYNFKPIPPQKLQADPGLYF